MKCLALYWRANINMSTTGCANSQPQYCGPRVSHSNHLTPVVNVFP